MRRLSRLAALGLLLVVVGCSGGSDASRCGTSVGDYPDLAQVWSWDASWAPGRPPDRAAWLRDDDADEQALVAIEQDRDTVRVVRLAVARGSETSLTGVASTVYESSGHEVFTLIDYLVTDDGSGRDMLLLSVADSGIERPPGAWEVTLVDVFSGQAHPLVRVTDQGFGSSLVPFPLGHRSLAFPNASGFPSIVALDHMPTSSAPLTTASQFEEVAATGGFTRLESAVATIDPSSFHLLSVVLLPGEDPATPRHVFRESCSAASSPMSCDAPTELATIPAHDVPRASAAFLLEDTDYFLEWDFAGNVEVVVGTDATSFRGGMGNTFVLARVDDRVRFEVAHFPSALRDPSAETGCQARVIQRALGSSVVRQDRILPTRFTHGTTPVASRPGRPVLCAQEPSESAFRWECFVAATWN